MGLFSKNNDVYENYCKDLKEAGFDYDRINQVQKKYANYFEKDKCTAESTVEDGLPLRNTQYVYFHREIKDFYLNNAQRLIDIGAIFKVKQGPVCIECGEKCNHLFLLNKHDSVAICWGCVKEDNYIDNEDTIICINGGEEYARY